MAFRQIVLLSVWCIVQDEIELDSCFWCCEKVEYYQQLIYFSYHIFHNGEDPSSSLVVKLGPITPRKESGVIMRLIVQFVTFVCLCVCQGSVWDWYLGKPPRDLFFGG